MKGVTVPESRGIYMGLDSDAAIGIKICADTNQYMDFITMLNNYKGRLIYNETNNDFLKLMLMGKPQLLCHQIIQL